MAFVKGQTFTIVQGPDRWNLAAAVVNPEPEFIPHLLTFSTKDEEYGEQYFAVVIRNITQMTNARDSFQFEGFGVELSTRDALQAGNSPSLKELWKKGPKFDLSIRYYIRTKQGTILVIRTPSPAG